MGVYNSCGAHSGALVVCESTSCDHRASDPQGAIWSLELGPGDELCSTLGARSSTCQSASCGKCHTSPTAGDATSYSTSLALSSHDIRCLALSTHLRHRRRRDSSRTPTAEG